MNNRFLKKNFWLLAAVSACSLVALGLLIFTLVEYVQMYGYITKVEDFRKQIEKIIRQRPAPVEGNKPLLQQDIELYSKVAAELRLHFGHPMQPALDKFFSVLRVRKGAFGEDTPDQIDQARFMEEFHKSWDSIDPHNYPRQRFFLNSEFQPKFANWHQAQAEFIKAAQPYTLELLSADNADEVLLSSLGIPRRLAGENDRLMRVINEVREQLIKELGDKVQLAVGASGLGFGIVGPGENRQENAAAASQGFAPDDFPIILEHLGIISDMLRRSNGSGIKTIFDVRIRLGESGNNKEGEGGGQERSKGYQNSVETVGAYRIFHYQLEVSGTMESIRNLVKQLDNAYGDRRVYLVKSIFLYAEENGAAGLFSGAGEETPESGVKASGAQAVQQPVPSPSRRSRRRSRRNVEAMDEVQESQSNTELERKRKQEEALRRYQEQQARLPYDKRDGYGDVLIGGGETFRALIDVEYVALSGR